MSDRRRQYKSSYNSGAPDSSADEVVFGKNVPIPWSDAAPLEADDQTTLELKTLARILIDAVRENMRRGETN